MQTWIADLLGRSAALDSTDGMTIDVSPGAYGNNTLGANDGAGRPLNPVTGAPYAPQVVLRGDFARVMAEFWADGPKSETPPGHWFVIANGVADNPATTRQLFGAGDPLDPLAWDVHVYLALGGAVHDAAIAAWEQKRLYTALRPISTVRYLAQRGQSTEADAPDYDPHGLPLIPGVVERITAESAAPGQRHAHLASFVGQLAVKSWRGEPGDRASEVGGVGWIRAIDWIPYQRRTFVTPAFPGFVSGHSTFSRAAAEVLAALTGSPYFPGGLGEFVAPAGTLPGLRGRPQRRRAAAVGDVLRRVGSGGAVAHLRRHPPSARRFRRAHRGQRDRQGRGRSRAHLFRRHGAAFSGRAQGASAESGTTVIAT